jgi:hypothetical protein
MTTKLERHGPHLTELARELGGEIKYDGGLYWFCPGWYQLTIPKLSETERVRVATGRLERVIKARASWGTRLERVARLVERIRAARLPGRMEILECVEPTLDKGGLWCPFGEWEAKLDLAGEASISAKGLTADAAINEVEARARRALGIRLLAAEGSPEP